MLSELPAVVPGIPACSVGVAVHVYDATGAGLLALKFTVRTVVASDRHFAKPSSASEKLGTSRASICTVAVAVQPCESLTVTL